MELLCVDVQRLIFRRPTLSGRRHGGWRASTCRKLRLLNYGRCSGRMRESATLHLMRRRASLALGIAHALGRRQAPCVWACGRGRGIGEGSRLGELVVLDRLVCGCGVVRHLRAMAGRVLRVVGRVGVWLRHDGRRLVLRLVDGLLVGRGDLAVLLGLAVRMRMVLGVLRLGEEGGLTSIHSGLVERGRLIMRAGYTGVYRRTNEKRRIAGSGERVDGRREWEQIIGGRGGAGVLGTK